MKCEIKIVDYDENVWDIWFHRTIVVSVESDENIYTFQYLHHSERVELEIEPNYKNIRHLAKIKHEYEAYVKIKKTILEKIK